MLLFNPGLQPNALANCSTCMVLAGSHANTGVPHGSRTLILQRACQVDLSCCSLSVPTKQQQPRQSVAPKKGPHACAVPPQQLPTTLDSPPTLLANCYHSWHSQPLIHYHAQMSMPHTKGAQNSKPVCCWTGPLYTGVQDGSLTVQTPASTSMHRLKTS
jgi:hypothetical protein